MQRGGIGSAIADIIGYPLFAPYTLVIKRLEGFVAGSIRDGKSTQRDLPGWLVGAIVMVSGYLAEAYMMSLGVPAATGKVPFNVVQVLSGAVVAIPLAREPRNRIPKILI